MRRSLRAAWLIPAAALSTGCADIFAPSPDPGTFQAVQLDGRITHAYTGFGFDLYRALLEEKPRENLFISPTSAASALTMTYNGAATATRDSMAKALGIDGIPLDQVNAANRTWLAALRDTQDRTVELSLANSIWARAGFPFHAAFFDRNREHYDAEAGELPFDDAALATINGWVDRSTKGRIDSILDEIDPDHVMFLINALYFKGQWRYRFDESKTHEAPFTRADGSRVLAGHLAPGLYRERRRTRLCDTGPPHPKKESSSPDEGECCHPPPVSPSGHAGPP